MNFCKVITGVILLLSLLVIFFCMHVVGCVFLCPRNARVALACASWRATTARALWNRLLGSRDPPARSILRERRHTNRIQHDASLNRTDPRFPLRGTAQASFCFSHVFGSIFLVHFVIVFQVYFPRWAVQVNENYVTLIYDVFRSIVDRKIMLGTSTISRMLEVRLGKRVSY